MKTSRNEKLRYIEAGSQIRRELLELQPVVVVDCGACDGLDSIIYSRLLPGAQVYAIEARADNYHELQDNVLDFNCKNITPINACLSDAQSEAPFWSSYGDSGNRKEWETGNKSSSIMQPTGHVTEHRWCRFSRGSIKTLRFDALAIPVVDFLHLDVQGAEIKVLIGFGKALNSLRMVWLEVARKELYQGQPLASDVEAFMLAQGFRKVKDTCNNKYGDQLWSR